MKCPKCGFNSFEFHDTCKKCGKDLVAFKASYNIRPLVHPRKKKELEDPLLAAAAPAGHPAPPAPADEIAAPLLDAGEFAFESTPLEPIPPSGKGAREPLSRKADAAPPEPPKEFSLEDFIHLGDLNAGGAKAEPPRPAARTAPPLEDILPQEEQAAAEAAGERQTRKVTEPKGEKPQGLEWLE